MDLRPTTMKDKGKTLDKDEERVSGAKETKTLQNDYSQQNMARYGKPKRNSSKSWSKEWQWKGNKWQLSQQGQTNPPDQIA